MNKELPEYEEVLKDEIDKYLSFKHIHSNLGLSDNYLNALYTNLKEWRRLKRILKLQRILK